ncbi:hypothetical protein ORI98_10950 [Shewanella sp. ULN5]|uniref:hypothetical protein n=1 Tax=Shewanella sp. ULN5 TaxID=2994678 RepID=UPI00273D43F3|nr:hypothetical protein [Shewanella sp. ULN5]MDP5146950.1 hypothetical protein [Shewanella sp. ULN5]
MLNYKVRTAFLSNSVFRYCNKKNFPLHESYEKYNSLKDSDLTRFNLLSDIIEFINRNSDDKYFIIDMLNTISIDWSEFYLSKISGHNNKSNKLAEYYHFYTNNHSNLNWKLSYDGAYIRLSNPATSKSHISLYEDLLLVYLSKSKILECETDDSKVFVNVSFSRNDIFGLTEVFEGIEFNSEKTSLSINSEQHKHIETGNSKIDLKSQIIAASNEISMCKLNMKEIAYTMGVSNTTLSRKCEKYNLNIKDLLLKIKQDKANLALNKNKNCFKKASFECGYANTSGLSKLLKNL